MSSVYPLLSFRCCSDFTLLWHICHKLEAFRHHVFLTSVSLSEFVRLSLFLMILTVLRSTDLFGRLPFIWVCLIFSSLLDWGYVVLFLGLESEHSVPFSWNHIKGTYTQCELSSLMLTLTTWLNGIC